MRLFVLALFAMLPTWYQPGWAWDGNWTDAKSGQDYIYSPENSTGRSGVKEPPQVFLNPPPRDYTNVDPKELQDYFGHRQKDYSPYALLRLPQTLRYGDTVIPGGYYQVKAGNWGDGSASKRLDAPFPGSTTGTPAPSASNPPPAQRVFVLKQLGNVIAVIPVHQIEPYTPKRKDKIPKRRALAWLEIEDRHSVLRFYDRHWLYTTHFQ